MALVPYDRPRGAIHDLAKLAEISSDRCRILCVSDRTLYLLANLASVDISFFARFAVELTENGYYPLERVDPEYALYEQVKTAFQLEVLDMSCNIETGLLAIADAIASQGGGGGGCADYSSPVLNCIADLPNDELLGPDDSTQGNPGADPPPEGFATWEEYFDYKCKAAAFIWDLERKHMVNLRNFEGAALVASIVGPSVAGLLGVLPAAMTPAGFAVFVASVVAIGVVAAASWFYMDEMIDYWDANREDIICSLYSSGSSPQAVSALAGALEDAIQAIVTWGVLAPVAGTISGLLSTTFSQIAGNGVVEPLFKTVIAATQFEADCSACDEGEADLVLTGLIAPYNRLLVGDDIDFRDESATLGYQTRNSGEPRLWTYFYAPVNISDWTISGEHSAPDHPGETLHRVIHVDRFDDPNWTGLKTYGPTEFDADVWTWFEIDVDDVPLTEGTYYRVQWYVQEFNYYTWYRRMKASSL